MRICEYQPAVVSYRRKPRGDNMTQGERLEGLFSDSTITDEEYGIALDECSSSIYSLAWEVKGKYPFVDFDDLVQQGRLGVLRAMLDYDAKSGNKFITYAYYWIRQFMLSYLPFVGGVYKTKRSFSTMVSIEDMQNGSKPFDIIAGEETVDNSIRFEGLRVGLLALKPGQRDALSLYFGLDGEYRTLAEVGAVMDDSSECV